MSEVVELAQRAREASTLLAIASAVQRDQALVAMSQALIAREGEILAANDEDMRAARGR